MSSSDGLCADVRRLPPWHGWLIRDRLLLSALFVTRPPPPGPDTTLFPAALRGEGALTMEGVGL